MENWKLRQYSIWRLLGFEELTTKTSDYSIGYRMLYLKSGTFTGCRSTDDVNHAVLLIGYKAGVGWKIKNSWGTRWGEGGYAWIS
jgi:C1A family cysteine protease